MKTLQGMINLTIDIQLDRKRLVIKDRISNAASIDDVDLDKYLIPSEISRFAYSYFFHILLYLIHNVCVCKIVYI